MILYLNNFFRNASLGVIKLNVSEVMKLVWYALKRNVPIVHLFVLAKNVLVACRATRNAA